MNAVGQHARAGPVHFKDKYSVLMLTASDLQGCPASLLLPHDSTLQTARHPARAPRPILASVDKLVGTQLHVMHSTGWRDAGGRTYPPRHKRRSQQAP